MTDWLLLRGGTASGFIHDEAVAQFLAGKEIENEVCKLIKMDYENLTEEDTDDYR